ncbi:uncharacterized protein LOC106160643 [Lingula anatina]|uniref:Uncharacterized protein LOC106160643 n=1 Tax=Lingula anatina TaxID=7574 RepID=A0A1S3I5V2_LINAN|nr:uncharacterized protein LOC106160643 [Lingula anatina]|eukprot:XP_013392754.1 uncharacterized protein LOC106160643 [Lingula anatina]
MARNEEKQFGRLNRLILQKEKEEQLKKNPPRPRLDTLNAPEEIKKWIPSLQKDIDFNLKQSQVPCYPESKIQEYKDNVNKYERLYKAFLKKLKTLDPTASEGDAPWNDRPYSGKKRRLEEESDDGKISLTQTAEEDKFSKMQKIETPLLDLPENMSIVKDGTNVINLNVDIDCLDKPLEFNTVFTKSNINKCCIKKAFSNKSGSKLKEEDGHCMHAGKSLTNASTLESQSSYEDSKYKRNNVEELGINGQSFGDKFGIVHFDLHGPRPQSGVSKESSSAKMNLLGLDYDTSSDSDRDSDF